MTLDIYCIYILEKSNFTKTSTTVKVTDVVFSAFNFDIQTFDAAINALPHTL